jgi:hypothetical protein
MGFFSFGLIALITTKDDIIGCISTSHLTFLLPFLPVSLSYLQFLTAENLRFENFLKIYFLKNLFCLLRFEHVSQGDGWMVLLLFVFGY